MTVRIQDDDHVTTCLTSSPEASVEEEGIETGCGACQEESSDDCHTWQTLASVLRTRGSRKDR